MITKLGMRKRKFGGLYFSPSLLGLGNKKKKKTAEFYKPEES